MSKCSYIDRTNTTCKTTYSYIDDNEYNSYDDVTGTVCWEDEDGTLYKSKSDMIQLKRDQKINDILNDK